MNLRMVRVAEWLGALAGAFLIASLFFDWYKLSPGGAGESAWQSLAVIDIVCAVCGVMALCLPLAFSLERLIPVSIALSSLTAGIAALCTLLVLFRAIVPPSSPTAGTELASASGVYLGLVASAATTVAASISLHDERFVGIGEEGPPVRKISLAEAMAARRRAQEAGR